jgi:hypothetical protein
MSLNSLKAVPRNDRPKGTPGAGYTVVKSKRLSELIALRIEAMLTGSRERRLNSGAVWVEA